MDERRLPAESYLNKWAAANELCAARFVARLDDSASSDFYITPAQLARIDTYCAVYDNEPVMTEASFEVLLRSLFLFPAPAGLSILEKSAPVLFRMLVYMARYPFLPQPTPQKVEPMYLTRNGLLRAAFIAHKDRSYRFFGGEGGMGTRAHTPADHIRLLFQGLAVQVESDPPGYDEDVWKADAADRAQKFVSPLAPKEVYCPDNALTNRDETGDETFHDIVDFMYELQPEWPHRVKRVDLLEVAKNMVQAEGLCAVPLQRYVLMRTDFEELVTLLLVVHESPEGETLPADFDKRRDKVVGEFFGERERIDFRAFYGVFESGRTEFRALLNVLYTLLDQLVKK